MTKLKGWRMALAMFALATTATSGQTFKTLFDFNKYDGARPNGVLVQGTDGTSYGTTLFDGGSGAGTIFRITPTGNLTTLYNFCSQNDCIPPGDDLSFSGLTLATNGDFYGTTNEGGLNDCEGFGCGTVYKITPGGSFSTVYSFCGQGYPCIDGFAPYAGLVQASNGDFYGTTYYGGANGAGTVFKITEGGSLTTVYNFCSQSECTDGANPYGGVIQATDGSLYGTTQIGGANGEGTVFKFALDGAFTTLYSFCQGSCLDGGQPLAGLIEGNDGNFYGTTEYGGASNDPSISGTVFKITPTGTLTTLHSFCVQGYPCPDGYLPVGGLVQATDSGFYGTASEGGPCYGGTLFKITSRGAMAILHNFCNSTGEWPVVGLLQGTNGKLYGSTASGGTDSSGTIYSLDMGFGPFVAFVRGAAEVGQEFGILGQGFTGTTSVMLNGVATNFTVVSDTFIKATVPQGATTGYVSVTTPDGVLKSNVPFHVIP